MEQLTDTTSSVCLDISTTTTIAVKKTRIINSSKKKTKKNPCLNLVLLDVTGWTSLPRSCPSGDQNSKLLVLLSPVPFLLQVLPRHLRMFTIIIRSTYNAARRHLFERQRQQQQQPESLPPQLAPTFCRLILHHRRHLLR